jgi:hypothetical protein
MDHVGREQEFQKNIRPKLTSAHDVTNLASVPPYSLNLKVGAGDVEKKGGLKDRREKVERVLMHAPKVSMTLLGISVVKKLSHTIGSIQTPFMRGLPVPYIQSLFMYQEAEYSGVVYHKVYLFQKVHRGLPCATKE